MRYLYLRRGLTIALQHQSLDVTFIPLSFRLTVCAKLTSTIKLFPLLFELQKQDNLRMCHLGKKDTHDGITQGFVCIKVSDRPTNFHLRMWLGPSEVLHHPTARVMAQRSTASSNHTNWGGGIPQFPLPSVNHKHF